MLKKRNESGNIIIEHLSTCMEVIWKSRSWYHWCSRLLHPLQQVHNANLRRLGKRIVDGISSSTLLGTFNWVASLGVLKEMAGLGVRVRAWPAETWLTLLRSLGPSALALSSGSVDFSFSFSFSFSLLAAALIKAAKPPPFFTPLASPPLLFPSCFRVFLIWFSQCPRTLEPICCSLSHLLNWHTIAISTKVQKMKMTLKKK